MQILKIFISFLDKIIQLIKLSKTASRLPVSDFQIIAHMRICVFVIITKRQITELHIKSLLAGVIFSRRTPTITPPISERHYYSVQICIVCNDCTAFAHCDMVSRIKAVCADMSDCSRKFTVIFCA